MAGADAGGTSAGAAGAEGGAGGVATAGTAGSAAGEPALGGAGGGGSGGAPTGFVPVTEPNATGEGPCASTTLGDVIAAVHAAHPELAVVSTVYDPNGSSAPEDAAAHETVYAWSSSGGYRLAFAWGIGECPSGCIDFDYFYFETDERCAPVAAGDYHLFFDETAGCGLVSGMPLWGVPSERAAPSDCPRGSELPPGMNDDCVDGLECAIGLTPLTFVSSTGGHHACVCGIPCEDDPSVCPATTTCTSQPPGLPLTLCM